MKNWNFDEKILGDPKFGQNCSKVNIQWDWAKTKFRLRFRFLIKSWIFDEKFWLIQNSPRIALKSISIEIEPKKIWSCEGQFRAILGRLRPLRAINSYAELLNAVLNYLKSLRGLLKLEHFKAVLAVASLLRPLDIDKGFLKLLIELSTYD